MAIATAAARTNAGNPVYSVVGVELDSEGGRRRAAAIAKAELPFVTTDSKLLEVLAAARDAGNLTATVDPDAFSSADIVVVDVHLDIDLDTAEANIESFRAAIRTVSDRIKPGALLLVETTVPPGTTEKIVKPEIAAALKRRDLPAGSVMIAHSYERVMPGPTYYDSIVGMDRVYAGDTPAAADACEAFLRSMLDTKRAQLIRLKSLTASETAKVLENTYRAVTIALMDEWGRFAESAGVDLFEVVDAIRLRPTHSNIRQPGLGVGGYCLSKDPLFGIAATRQVLGVDSTAFPISRLSMSVNRAMPLRAFETLQSQWPGGVKGKTILVCGVTYRSDVDDTRFSPSEPLVRAVRGEGAIVVLQDPLARRWVELEEDVPEALPTVQPDAIVLAVAHGSYRSPAFFDWLVAQRGLIFDANRVLPDEWISRLSSSRRKVLCLGRGDLST